MNSNVECFLYCLLVTIRVQSHVKYNFTFSPSLRKYIYSYKTERDAANRRTHTHTNKLGLKCIVTLEENEL